MVNRKPPQICIVVPCYNEEEVLRETSRRLQQIVSQLQDSGDIAQGSHVLFVDDGSRDSTWSIIEELAGSHASVKGLKFARNFGHQSALLAGMLTADADAVVTIDADLQDPPEAIAQMVHAFRNGSEIVFAVRDDRKVDSIFKRGSAELYYRVLRLMGVDIIFNHADFRLLGRAAVDALRQFGEVNIFLRGLVRLIGFKHEIVLYRREARFAGETKYTLRKMLALSMNGITSFTILPLRLITVLGFAVSVFAFFAGFWVFVAWLYRADLVPGWTSVVLPMYFLGGIQLLSVGVLGEYLGKSYMEAKNRPRYIIEKTV